jgi:hypothetical protein
MYPGSLAYALPGVASGTAPFPDIEFVSSDYAVSGPTATITIPTHQAGDLLVMIAVNIDDSSTPSAPGGEGWTLETSASRTGFGAKNFRTYSKVAASGSVTTGTWSATDWLICHVYRNASGLGAGAVDNDGASNPDLPGLTLEVSDGSSWVMNWAGQNGATNNEMSETSGLTRREMYEDPSGGPPDEVFASWDTNGGASSFSGKSNISSGITSLDWISLSVEILKATS